jgi:hypothetical protein
LRHGEQIAVVDRKLDREGLTLPVIPAQRHRFAGGEHIARCGPHGVGVRQRGGTRGRPAEAGEIGVAAAVRREQADGRRILVDRLALCGQHQIVDLRALEIDRSGEARRGDLHARGLREDNRTILRHLRAGGNGSCWVGQGNGLAVYDRRRGLIRGRREAVGQQGPAEQHERGQHERHDQVALFVHR